MHAEAIRKLQQIMGKEGVVTDETQLLVELMAGTVGDRLGVKASGGIRTAEAAVAMLDAGATRLGLSGTRAVLDGLD